MNPYGYHNDQLGIRANLLISGENADENSLCLIGERGLRHRIESGFIKRLRKPGPNSPTLVLFNTLPRDWQKEAILKLGEPEKQSVIRLFEKYYKRDPRAIDFYYNYMLADGKHLPDTVIEEYVTNASVLNTVTKVYEHRRSYVLSLKGTPTRIFNPQTGETTNVWNLTVNDCNRFRDIESHTLPANAAALNRKLKDYKKEGYSALIHGNFCNKSALKVDDSVNNLLNSMFAYQSDKPTATQIARQYEGFLSGYVDVINSETGEIYNSKEFPKLSQATITNWLAKWTNKVGTHTLRSGDRQMWMSKFKPYHSMKRPEFAGSIISVDDRQPPFWYEKGKRVWMYGGIDLGSVMITCWVFGRTKEEMILEFYRQMVRNYTEWGFNLPYELEGEMSGNSAYLKSFLDKGRMFQETHIEANVARAKRIEPYWKPLRYGTEKKREGWIARPNALSEPNQAGPQKHIILPYDQIVEECTVDIRNWNNSEHPVIKGKTRWQVFRDTQHPKITPTNWRAFLPFLGYKTQTSCNTGIIRLNNNEFLIGENGSIAFSDRLIFLLSQVEGKDLDIYWIDDNYGKVLKALVYLRGTDRCICEAVAKPVYHRAKLEQTAADLEDKELMCMYVSSVTGYINTRRKAIERVTVIDNIPQTLNDDFQIPGLRRPVNERIGPVETMPPVEEYENEDDLNSISTPFNKGLYERF
jgi:hypothetical protein